MCRVACLRGKNDGDFAVLQFFNSSLFTFQMPRSTSSSSCSTTSSVSSSAAAMESVNEVITVLPHHLNHYCLSLN